MDTSEHPNSHIVYIRRAPMFAGEARKELEEFYAESHKGVGSYFQKGSIRTATGMTTDIEDLLMPYLISLPKEDRDFRNSVNIFFQNLETKVPAHRTDPVTGLVTGGKPLEIGLLGSNLDPMSRDNLPINIEHWIRYHHAMGHPQVAESEATGKGNVLKQYFIYDPEEVSAGNIGINEQKDEALSQYLVIKDKPQKVNMYLTLMGKNIAQIKRGEEAMTLRKLAEEKPAKFIEVTNDKEKETKFLIEEMINHKILDKVGNNILLNEKDGNDIIGRDIREAVVYLKDARNSRTAVMLKSRLQEKWKKSSISVETDEDLEPELVDAGTEGEPKAQAPKAKVTAKNTGEPATDGGLGDVE